MKKLKLLTVVLYFSSTSFLCSAQAALPNYNLHCEFTGKVVEIADETFPTKDQPGDKVVHVRLHLKGVGSGGFFTTGADYFARFKLGSNTISVYLHSSGYNFPLEKTVGVSVRQTNNQRVRLFYTNVQDYGKTIVESSVLKSLGIQGLDDFEMSLRVTCNDYGSE